jgi:hypothetical protein
MLCGMYKCTYKCTKKMNIYYNLHIKKLIIMAISLRPHQKLAIENKDYCNASKEHKNR